MLNEEHDQGVEYLLDRSQSTFDQTPKISEYSSSDSTNNDDDKCPLKWMVQRIMVHTSTKEKEKVVEKTPKMRPFTRAVTRNLIGDAM